MKKRVLLGLAAAVMALQANAAVADCADESVAPCVVPMGEYHIRLPEMAREGMPAVVFLHGFGGNAKATIANARVVEPFLENGYAFIAPVGLRRRGDGPRSWRFLPDFGERDEQAFFSSVAQDAADRFGVDPEQVILAGFSAGGFMVSYLACDAPETFAAYAPVSGGFWRPHPESCAGPVRLFQTHGWSDKTVPLEGRSLRGGMYIQGDIFAGMEIWRDANACTREDPDATSRTDAFMIRRWTSCAPGSALEFALFPGGHTVPEGWSETIMAWFEQLSG